MGLNWFVQKNDQVEGPLSTEDVKARLQSGQLNASHMIWGRGLEAWMPLDAWNNELPRITNVAQIEVLPEMWHFAAAGKSHGPFQKSALVHQLKELESLADIMVWTKGMKEWAPLFEFHDILTAIGVNKRQFPRADLNGTATLRLGEQVLLCPLITLSEGGCGVRLESGLVAGQTMTIEMQSPSLRDVLHAKAEVRYVSEGIAGLRFTHINSENKGAIIQFVKQSQNRFVLKAA